MSAAAPPFSFLTRTDLANPYAVDVVSADFNGDGIADIASLGATDVIVFLGTGDHQFRLASVNPLPGLPNGYNRLVVADFNGDGKPDLGVFGGTGFVLLGNGDGTFRQGVTLANTTAPAVTADFNGDGKPDLAVGLRTANSYTIAILLGNGDGTFGAPISIPGSNASCLAVGDLNGDGKPDIATCNVVYLGNGDGTFSTGIPFTTPSPAAFLTIADLNKDGKADIVAIEEYLNGVNPKLGPIYILYGNGDGTFQPAAQVHSDAGRLLPAAAIGDINGDGWPDIVVLDTNGLVGVLTNNGHQGFNRAQVLPVTGPSSLPWGAVALADLTGDHRLDIIATGGASPFFSVLFHNRHGGFRDVESVAFSGAAEQVTRYNVAPVAEADFNGDGLPDLAFVIAQGNKVLINTVLRTGNRSQPFKPGPQTVITPPPNSWANGIVAADFNNDGKPDIAICFAFVSGANLPGIVQVYLGNGDGTFTQAPGELQLPLTAFQMVAADFNNDGNADLAFTSGYVALGNGDGTFGAPIQFYPSNGGEFGIWIGAADFNHDGKMDLAFQVCQGCESSPPLLVYLGNGDGTFQQPISYTWNGLAQWAAIADVNNDGIPDIVALSYTEGPNQPVAAVFLGNGDGTFKPPLYVRSTWVGQPNQMIVADLNGDGKPDLAITDWWENSVYLFAGNGDGTFGPQVQVGGASGPGWISSANLQGQTKPGFPDLLTVDFLPNGFFPVNGAGAAVSVLFNEGWK